MTNDESESCAISNYKSKILASTLAFVIISAISISLLPIRTSNASCATYNAASNTISITCDSTMPQVSSDVNNESVLKNLGGGEWLLKAILQINDGAKLTISSPEVSWLKIEGSNGIVVYGRIDITGSKITSWDSTASAPISQTSTGSTPRAYINLRASEGGTVNGAEIGYLGYDVNGKRGIDLYGTGASHDFTITGNSKVHDNWMGFYSSTGAYNIVIENSEFYNNIQYGIDPHTNTHDVRVSNVEVHHNKGIAIICSYQCTNITFENNKVHDNSKTGLMLSRQTTNSIVRNNQIYNQISAFTISVSESQNNQIYGNSIKDSTNGITVHNPSTSTTISTGNQLHDNTFDNVDTAFRAQASAQNTFSSNTFTKVNIDHFLLTSSASITIEHQTFSNTKIQATTGNDGVTIQNSGKIQLAGSNTIYDTDVTPFKMTLSSKTIVVNTVTDNGTPLPPPTVDSTRPSVKITSPATNANVPAGTVQVSGTASDNDAVKKVEVRVHKWVNGALGDLYLNYQMTASTGSPTWSTWSINLNIPDPGQYRVQARATDNSGNQNWNAVVITITS